MQKEELGVLTRSQKILASKVGMFSVESQSKIKNANYSDSEIYVAKKLGGTLTEMFGDTPIKKELGVTNIDDNMINKDMMVDALKVEFAADAADIGVKAAKFANILDAANADASILNGEIEVRVDGELVMENMPLANFFAVASTTFADDKGSRYVRLQSPILFLKGQRLEVAIRAAGGFTAANNYLKVTFSGVSFRQR